MYYAIFDRVLRSSRHLPELPVCSSSDQVISIGFSEPVDFAEDISWDHKWFDKSQNVSGCCKKMENGSFLVFIPGVAQFQIDPVEEVVQIAPSVNASDASVRHALLDRIVPMLLGQLGNQILHASAVVLKSGDAIAFVGDSGEGKSTLAGSLVAAGASLITDDCLMIKVCGKEVKIIPSYKGLRLRDDSARRVFGTSGVPDSVSDQSDKKRLRLILSENEPIEWHALSSLYLLSYSTSRVTVHPATQAGSLAALVKQHFFLDVKDKKQILSQFQHIRNLVESGLPVSELSYPRSYDLLPRVRQRVYESLNLIVEEN